MVAITLSGRCWGSFKQKNDMFRFVFQKMIRTGGTCGIGRGRAWWFEGRRSLP